ncbi:MAG: universal stress protein [Gemmatimonadota bacterium]
MGDQRAAQRRIVAGVDGSESSRAALAWAVHQARLTGAVVEAVIAWPLPATFGLLPLPHLVSLNTALKALADSVTGIGAPAEVRSRVMVGSAGKVLVKASAGAELLVLGSRGRGTLTGTLLGSVGVHCVRHAHCPVVVIRGAATAGSGNPFPARSADGVDWRGRLPLHVRNRSHPATFPVA